LAPRSVIVSSHRVSDPECGRRRPAGHISEYNDVFVVHRPEASAAQPRPPGGEGGGRGFEIWGQQTKFGVSDEIQPTRESREIETLPGSDCPNLLLLFDDPRGKGLRLPERMPPAKLLRGPIIKDPVWWICPQNYIECRSARYTGPLNGNTDLSRVLPGSLTLPPTS